MTITSKQMKKLKSLKPILDEPALLVNNFLVIADLHLGIENEFYAKGVAIPEQTGKLVKKIEKIVEKNKKIEHLIIVGDLKHLVPGTVFQEKEAIKGFLSEIKPRFKRIILTIGNHDVLLPELDIEIYPSTGFRFKDYGFFHGHAYPGEEVKKAGCWIIGHEHSAIEFRDSFGIRSVEPCWMRIKTKIEEKEKQIIVLPPFNPLLSIGGGNKDGFLSPVLKNVKSSEVEIFLLDGTYLGDLELIGSKRDVQTA